MLNQIATLSRELDHRLAALEASSYTQHVMIAEQAEAQSRMLLTLSELSKSMINIVVALTALTANTVPPSTTAEHSPPNRTPGPGAALQPPTSREALNHV
jgi:uncharacterized coiled-coil protein SlyX